MRVTPVYTSIGTNRASSSAACTSSGLLAFGAGQLVAVWDPESSAARGVQATLPGHKGQVTTVKLLDQDRFVSGDAPGEVKIWRKSSVRENYEHEIGWEAHKGASVSAIGSIGAQGSEMIFTGGSDGTVKVWKVGKAIEEVQMLDLKGRLPLDIEVAYLPGTQVPVLVLGLTDRRIQIWTFQDDRFVHSLSLEGHEDWVRCLSFTPYPSSSGSGQDLLLASGSQDNFIRLWRIASVSSAGAGSSFTTDRNGTGHLEGDGGLDLLDEFERRLAGESGNTQISTKAHVLAVQVGANALRYSITLEALLVGHESGLTNVRWSPSTSSSEPLLLSTATDNSLIIWTPSSSSTSTDGIWIPEHRFGAVGGRGLSFYGAIWGKDGQSVMAGGWNGGWERWVKDGDIWEVKAGLSGHFREVQSVVWDPRGEYLLSVGSDQTSRIHGASTLPSSSSQTVWSEIARPQIHGYDMTDAAFISPLRFVSGADEKVTRIFDAPEGFVESLGTLGVRRGGDRGEGSSRPKGATVPPLGLSNRALQKAPAAGDVAEKQGQNEAIISISHTLTSLPTEEELATSTLWPEIEKVYGHGYEIVTVAASHNGQYIATACRASNAEHAVIRVVSTSTWDLVGEVLKGHSLTITRIAFSEDDRRLLSVSRDRGWRVFDRTDDAEGEGFKSSAGEEKAHARMVLDGCWVQGRNDIFATASRDKTVKIWRSAIPDGTQWIVAATVKLNEAATAIDTIRLPHSQAGAGETQLLAVGTESGGLSIYSISIGSEEISTKLLLELDVSIAHALAVNRLMWRPTSSLQRILQLASCSDDRSVRVYDIDFDL